MFFFLANLQMDTRVGICFECWIFASENKWRLGWDTNLCSTFLILICTYARIRYRLLVPIRLIKNKIKGIHKPRWPLYPLLCSCGLWMPLRKWVFIAEMFEQSFVIPTLNLFFGYGCWIEQLFLPTFACHLMSIWVDIFCQLSAVCFYEKILIHWWGEWDQYKKNIWPIF